MDRTTRAGRIGHPIARRFAGILIGLAGLVGPAEAGLITFEQRPDGSTPIDDTRLLAPYAIEGGGTVSFFFDANNNLTPDAGDGAAWFEQVGNNGEEGFHSTYNSLLAGRPIHDRARPGYEAQLGQFFLRQRGDAAEGGVGVRPDPFVILYDTAQSIRSFSGEIWDIDGAPGIGTEQWLVEVFDAAGGALHDPLFSPVGWNGPDTLDSLPWTFGFTDLPGDVRAVRLTFVGTKTQGVGLAFNNFSATRSLAPVPEPSSLALAALGGLGLLSAARARRPAAQA